MQYNNNIHHNHHHHQYVSQLNHNLMIQKTIQQINNQIQLINMFQSQQSQFNNNMVTKIMILSRLKHILLNTPNDIYIQLQQRKLINDKYFYFILNHITQSSIHQKSTITNNNTTRIHSQHSTKQLSRLIFHTTSIRIKLWFQKKQFDDVFGSMVINIEHNKKIMPLVVEFFIQLVQVFEDRLIDGQGKGTRQQRDIDDDDRVNHHNSDRKHINNNNYNINNNNNFTNHSINIATNTTRQSLTHKTNNNIFVDDKITRKSQHANKHLHESIKNKSSFRKQNKFQRQFLNTELNRLLIFANQCFNRAVVQNPNFDYQQQQHNNSNSHNHYSQQQQQQQPAYYIKLPIPNITKILTLIHKILMFDFFGDRQRNLQDEYFTQKMPQIIPTKDIKYNRFEQIQNWIKNKTDAYKYQYIYFFSNNVQMKIAIVRLFGDMLRIHQKFFKKQLIFKVHLQTVVMLLKNMLQNLQIKYDEQYQLAIVFGESITKVLMNSTFPTFLNLTKPQFKKQLIETIHNFINKEILDQQLIDVRLVKYFIGFFVELVQRLNMNSSVHFRVRDFKQNVEIVVKRLGQDYEQVMYSCLVRQEDNNYKKGYAKYCGVADAVRQLNMEQFQQFFSIFRFQSPKKVYDKDMMTISQKCVWLCQKVQYNFYQYDRLIKGNNNNEQNQFDYTKYIKKMDLSRRHCLQCFAKLLQLMTMQINNNEIEQTEQQQYQYIDTQLNNYRYIVMTATFISQRLLNSKNNLLLLFDQSNYLFTFTKHVIKMFLHIKVMLTDCDDDNNNSQNNNYYVIEKRHSLTNLYHHALLLIELVTRLNSQLFQQKRKANIIQLQMRQLDVRMSMTASKKQRVNKRSNDDNRNKHIQQQQQGMKSECDNVLKEMQYYQKVVNVIAKQFLCLENNNRTEQQQKSSSSSDYNIITIDIDRDKDQQLLVRRGIKIVINSNDFITVIEQFYRLYFLAMFKYQLHRKKHITFIQQNRKKRLLSSKKKKKNKQRVNLSSPQYRLLQSQQDQQYQLNHINEDECSVIQEQQQQQQQQQQVQNKQLNQIKVNSQGNQQHAGCNINMNIRCDDNQCMNEIMYCVYMQLVMGDQQIKQQLQGRFIQWFQKTTTNKISEGQYNNDKNNKKLISSLYLQIYSLNNIMTNLVNNSYTQQQQNDKQQISNTNNKTNQNLHKQTYLLKLTNLLLKLFRHSKYHIQIKKHILSALIDQIESNFVQIRRNNYKLQRIIYGDGDMDMNVGFSEDQLMAVRVQAMCGLLQSMVNLYFMQFRTNIFNVQFIMLFNEYSNNNNNNDSNNDSNNNNTKIITPLSPTQQQRLSTMLLNTKSTSQLFTQTIQFILQLPQLLIQNGFYTNIQAQIIQIIREVYCQFSQFVMIYVFGLDYMQEQLIQRVQVMNVVQVNLNGYQFRGNIDSKDNQLQQQQQQQYHQPNNNNNHTHQQKYAITITQNNIQHVIKAYTLLTRYIQKVLWLTYIAQQSRQWIIIRTREILPFIKQLYQFINDLLLWEKEMNYQCYQQVKSTVFYGYLLKFYRTLFQFIRYFLQNFQKLTLKFITDHLSLIENIYLMVEMGRKVNDAGFRREIDGLIKQMDGFVVFRTVPEQPHMMVNNQQYNHQPKSSVKKIKSPTSAINNKSIHMYETHKHQKQPSSLIIKYTGWSYISRLYHSSSTEILQQIQTYQKKYKHYNNTKVHKEKHTKTISKQSQNYNNQKQQQYNQQQMTQIDFNDNNNDNIYNNNNEIQQVDSNKKQNQVDGRKSCSKKRVIMSSIKKIRPLIQESQSINLKSQNQFQQLQGEILRQQQLQEMQRRKQHQQQQQRQHEEQQSMSSQQQQLSSQQQQLSSSQQQQQQQQNSNNINKATSKQQYYHPQRYAQKQIVDQTDSITIKHQQYFDQTKFVMLQNGQQKQQQHYYQEYCQKNKYQQQQLQQNQVNIIIQSKTNSQNNKNNQAQSLIQPNNQHQQSHNKQSPNKYQQIQQTIYQI